jgi:hypothetical protein
MKVLPSLGGFFEFFDNDVFRRERKRVVTGPWHGSLPGVLREVRDKFYHLSARDDTSGADYTFEFKHKHNDSIEIVFSFTAPIRGANLSFEILKVSSAILMGSQLSSEPVAAGDSKEFPLKPSRIGHHLLLRNKNRVLIKGVVCDLEILDVKGGRSINVADFRNAGWDKEKSLYLGADLSDIRPGRRYSFIYEVRIRKPSLSLPSLGRATGAVVEDIDTRPVVSVRPKQQVPRTGYFQIKPETIITNGISGRVAGILADEIEKLTGMTLAQRPFSDESLSRDLSIVKASSRNQTHGTPCSSLDWYEIDVSEQSIQVSCNDEPGCLYGAYALLQMIQKTASGWIVPAQHIRDWPELSVRAIQLEMLRPANRDVEFFKRYLNAFFKARVNTIIFFHEPRQILAWRNKVDEGWWTKQQIAEIAAYARTLGMHVYGGMTSKFDSKVFPQLDIVPGSNFYNPFSGDALRFLFSLYQEIIDAYQPSAFLIGHDEVRGLSFYSNMYNTTSAEVFARAVTAVHDWFAFRNIPIILAGDMLLDRNQWEGPVGSANSLSPIYNSGATHPAADLIPKGISIMDWHYDNRPTYPSIKYFRERGFQVLACSWHDPRAANSLARSAIQHGANGIVATDFGFWSTLSPAATTLYTPLLGWSHEKVSVEENSDVSALAAMLAARPPVASMKQLLLDLKPSFNKSSCDISAQEGKGIFGVGPFLDLRALKPGDGYYGDILFNVVDPHEGEANNCVVMGNVKSGDKTVTPKKMLRMDNGKAKYIGFLHTCLLAEPRYRPHSIGKYNILYEDGSKSEIALIEGWNITDVRSSVGLRLNDWTFARSPDVLIGSQVVWRGESITGIPLNIQMFSWKNPHPDKLIKGIEAVITEDKQPAKVALFAVTLLD